MNVPLKKRHNYGKLNGSASSLNEPSAKRLHSTHSNDDDDDDDDEEYSDEEYEEESSNMDESLQNGPATLGALTIKDQGVKRPFQYLSIEDMAVPGDIHDDIDKIQSSSSSVILSSSASNHDSSERIPVESSSSSSESDSSGSSRSSNNENNSEVRSICDPLTEEALIQHNAEFEAMNSKERIDYWNIADEFSEIEDDFDDKKYFSKPIRSERLQKRMYTKPAPVFLSSRKSKKEDKSRKTDEKPSNSTKKTKADTKEAKKTPPKVTPKKNEKPQNRTTAKEKSQPPPPPVASVPAPAATPTVEPPTKPIVVERMSAIVVPVVRPMQPLVNNRIVESRPASEIPSAIKFRVSYVKDTSIRSNSFKTPTTPNTSRISDGGCANCSKHSRLNDSFLTTSSLPPPPATHHNQEEFYKYLGIDTNPSQEKSSPELSPNDANSLYNHRRSLRVFVQQKQGKFTRATNEKSPRDDKSLDKAGMRSPMVKSYTSNSDSTNVYNHKQQTPENGKLRDEQTPNGAMKSISSHIKQRHSYEPPSSDGDGSRPNNEPSGSNNNSSLKETDTECDATKENATDSNRFGDGSGPSKVARVQKRIVLPSPMMLTKMFERYKQCFKQGFAMRQGYARRKSTFKKRSSNNLQPKETSTQEENAEKPAEINGEHSTDDTPITTCEELINTFSPTSITHSNASTDSAIVINSNINDMTQPTVTLDASNSLQWQQDLANHIDKSQFQNPLDPKHGAILAILTHSVSPNHDEVIVVIQQSQISYWYSTSKVLGMFGVARSWMKIGDITRVQEDKEIDALYQNRLIDLGEQFPVYVEMRAKESGPNEFRQCNLTFVYVNVYFVKPNADGQPEIVTERVNLDTIKGYANSIYYTALRTSPSVLMTWTEQNVNNQTRCSIVKYTLKTPSLDNIDDIFDYSYLQHDINTLYAINDYHVVGCGDRTVSMWDHRNGNLLIDIEIELPTIGRNIACYTVGGGDDVPDYMLLIQLASAENGDEQLKVMAVQTIHPYNWRTLQTHNIPNCYGKIRSIFNQDDMLMITFINGAMMYLNISSPHKIYIRNVTNEQKKSGPQMNGINQAKSGSTKAGQLFAQCNGQIIEIVNDRVVTKSVWEYFIDKD
ncbi:uncharacterized protein LOC129569712 [Sitodiplosis mosellana]|uniref:uncharacterized protein LOC129569712 n=1 Tax=Sitodiplosis mosellana TaxID=263140 RepID=UPI00244440F0|nr:uncharacterized protein LOC129569712 [Sitodiplosis mosellana]